MMPTTDYDRIERAILYLDQHYRAQPSLAEVAAGAGLSEYHFQRLFTRWAGISPKRFLQFQTVQHAKHLLEESRSLLATSWEVGLSGPGRLHDLFVSSEAVTPGSYKAAGEGLRIAYGIHLTPFGRCAVAATELGVCGLVFLGDRTDRTDKADEAVEAFRGRWHRAEFQRDQAGTASVVRSIFGLVGADGAAPLRLHLRGTNFQLKVWEALLRIPSGAVAAYEDVAAAIGDPKAVRAVGTAVGQNPVAYLIPCHRVIRKTGAFGNYRWGSARKQAMLGWEAARKLSGVEAPV